MKKMLCAMMALVLLCGMLSGCSLFTSDNKTETNAPASTAADTAGSTEAAATDSKAPETTEAGSGSTGDIKMTDKYTFTDPADLTFETRYALYCDKNSSVVSTAASYGVKAMYAQMCGAASSPRTFATNRFLLDNTKKQPWRSVP